MPRFEFLHAADIHLDSPLRGLSRYPGAPVEAIRQATRRALVNLVDLAINRKVAFLLIAGDLYDGDWDNCNTGLFFVEQMARLGESGINVFVISGNHDAASKITRTLPLPASVHLFPVDQPQTVVLDDLPVALHGQGFPRPAVYDNLAKNYPQAVPGSLNIGLLHTSASSDDQAHQPYAPCRLEELRQKDYQYWALGHIHQRQTLCQDPWVVFSGNLQGRHIRESGPKGCQLVTVEDDRITSVQPEWLDVLRWERCQVDAAGARQTDELLIRTQTVLRELISGPEVRPMAVRVEFGGSCPAHGSLLSRREHFANEVRAMAIDTTGGTVWVEKVVLGTHPPRDHDRLKAAEGPLAELRGLIKEIQGRPKQLEAIAGELAELQRKLPAELIQGPDPLELAHPDRLKTLVAEVGQLLAARLIEEAS